jgi:hypothetical protein
LAFTEIINQFKEVSVTLLLNGVFIYAAIQLINVGVAMLKAKQLQAAGGGAARAQAPGEANVVARAEGEARNPEMETEVKTLMDRAMRDCGGDRVTIMRFNTPNALMSLIPYQFMSCTHDVYREGKLPVAHIMQNISTSLFSKFLISLQTEPYVILDLDDVQAVSKAGYELVRAQDEKKSLCVSLRDKESKPVGYVALKKNTEFTKENIETFEKFAKEVSFLLARGNSASGW